MGQQFSGDIQRDIRDSMPDRSPFEEPRPPDHERQLAAAFSRD